MNEDDRRGRMSTLVAQSKANAADWRSRSKLTQFAREYGEALIKITALLSGAAALLVFGWGMVTLMAVL